MSEYFNLCARCGYPESDAVHLGYRNYESGHIFEPIEQPITCEQCGHVFEHGATDASARFDFCSQVCENKYREDVR